MDSQWMMKMFQEGRIEKKVFWKLMRERFLPLLEYQNILKENEFCQEIKIRKNAIILNSGGVNLCFDFTQTISRAEGMLAMGGDYEQEDVDFLADHILPGDVVFDVGGNVGFFSLALMKQCPGAESYSFEPLPSTYEKMQRNLELNQELATRIHAFQLGFGVEIGELVFYLPGTDQAASLRPLEDEFYLEESDAQGKYTGRAKLDKVICKVETLDNFCREHAILRMDVLKCDVEGAEQDVLLGGEESLIRWKPLVYCEMLRKHAKRFGYHPNDIIHYMANLGYSCFTFRDHNLVPFYSMDENTQESNYFFFHHEKHAKMIHEIDRT